MLVSKFKNLPKIELHLHLDCSLSYDVVKKIDPTIDLKYYKSSFQAGESCSSLDDYLKCADNAIHLMQTKENLEFIVEDLFKQLHDDNVIYVEIRFAPLLHCEGELNAEKVVDIICKSASIQSKKYNIDYGLILCTLRHYTQEQSMETIKLVKEFSSMGVVGFDIAADEAGYPIDNHIKAFTYAKKNNLNITAHAGEAKGSESIWETIEKLHATRIGHGVRCTEDSGLVNFLAENNYHLEICLTSNLKTKTFNSYLEHTLNKIYDSSISLSLNTDGRTISNTTLSKEYLIAYKEFNWDLKKLKKTNLEAIKFSFSSEETKDKLIKIISSSYLA